MILIKKCIENAVMSQTCLPAGPVRLLKYFVNISVYKVLTYDHYTGFGFLYVKIKFADHLTLKYGI